MHAAQSRFPTLIGKEWNGMNSLNFSKKLVLGSALLMAASAFAANKGSLVVSSPVQVAGKQLSAGEYSVQWEGSGPNIEASIMKGKKVVATAPAHMVELNQSASSDSAVVKTNDDGSRSLAQARFSGKKYALEFGEQGAASASGSSSK
jgi:hypothetical protein